ncbi:DUF3616 domain-containing protein [Alcaligenaceae bacterium]|nr:DUF3616 domain-containing protein [Alcaligenaceae bacterium]
MAWQNLFDPEWYLEQNPDVAEAVAQGLMTAWQHFEQYGQFEGRSPVTWFDAGFYLARNPDVAEAVRAGHTTAAQHFMQYGALEPRLIAPAIDLGAYLEANLDVLDAVATGQTSALEHLVTYGMHEARDLGNGISLAMFANDPVFNEALRAGDIAEALERIDAVAPFLPGFVAPQGWAPASDTPIPLDFVPPEDMKLVIPEGVKVPDDIELPDTFEPVAGGEEPGGEDPDGEDPDGEDPDGGGDLPPLPEPAVFRPQAGTTEGSSDASTAIALDEDFMVVADDEGAILRVYNREGGEAVKEWSITAAATAGGTGLGVDEIDLEASTRIGDTVYFTGSHSNKRNGSEANEREYLFSVQITGTGADTTFELLQVQDGLEDLLVAWDNDDGHGKGAGHYGLQASSAGDVIPEQVSGFSIEGMTASLDDSQLLLGFRAPQVDTQVREKALIIPVAVDSVFTDAPEFDAPIELNLGGRGIRSIEKAADGSGYLILAGPAGSATAEVLNDFRLYRWDGGADEAGLVELDVRNADGDIISLDSLLEATGGSFETLVDVASLEAGTRLQLLQDNGDTVWEGESKVSKDLDPEDQQFMGNWVELGEAAANKAPELVSSNVGSGADPIAHRADLVLRFDEAVRLNEGSIVLKQRAEGDGDDLFIQTFTLENGAADGVSVAYNVVTIDPTDDLEAGKEYVLEFEGNVFTDLSNLYLPAGLDAMSFTVAPPALNYSLLITEVTSKHTSDIDFFELYNYGTESIDLSGWGWTDSAKEKFGSFADGTTIAAGEMLVVVGEENKMGDFLSTWGLEADPARYVEVDGPGLGKQDGVILFDGGENTVAWFNYTGSEIVGLDGISLPSIPGGGNKHAGVAAGASDDAVSAVWDAANSTPYAPVYIAATDLPDGPVGTPGWIETLPVKPSTLLITEVTSKHTSDIDFFELYNYGTESIDLSGWGWTDSAKEKFGSFADGTTIAAGEVLVVVGEENKMGDFLSTWGLEADPARYVEVDGPGLGKQDGVILFDGDDNTMAWFNYTGSDITGLDGLVLSSIPGGGNEHAGVAAGASNDAVSAMWDGGSTTFPLYVAATELLGDSVMGSPGEVFFA